MTAEAFETFAAERVYLFRHALMRDAAYQLQLPGDRARLHELACFLIEESFGGRAPEPPLLDAIDPPPWQPHSTDPVAAELAEHARRALAAPASGVQVADAGPTTALHRLYLRRAAEHLERVFQAGDAAQAWQSLAELVAGAARGECHRRAGAVLHQAGQPLPGENAFQQALAIARQEGDRRLEGITLGNLANVYEETGRVELAERTYEQALAIAREVGNRRSEGMALGNLANVYRVTGRVEPAERTYEHALAIHREVGDRQHLGITLGNLANVYQQTGRMEPAERTYEEALAIHREVGDRRSEGITLGNLASVYREIGRVELAEPTYEQALAISRQVGDRRSEGITLGNLAGVYHETGRVALAEHTYERALAISRQVGDRRFEGIHFCEYAVCLAQGNQPEKARDCWLAGVAILHDLGDTAELERHTAAMRETCAKAGIPPLDADHGPAHPPSPAPT